MGGGVSAVDRPRTQHELLQEQVTQLLTMTGWRWLHVRKSVGKGNKWRTTTNVKGWPDLAPCWSPRQPGRFLALELKVPPDKLSADQAECRDELVAAGVEFHVVTPADLQHLAAILRPGGIRDADRGDHYPRPEPRSKGTPA